MVRTPMKIRCIPRASLPRNWLFCLVFVFMVALLWHPSRILQICTYGCQADCAPVVPLCGTFSKYRGAPEITTPPPFLQTAIRLVVLKMAPHEVPMWDQPYVCEQAGTDGPRPMNPLLTSA